MCWLNHSFHLDSFVLLNEKMLDLRKDRRRTVIVCYCPKAIGATIKDESPKPQGDLIITLVKSTLVNVYVDLVVFTPIAGTLKPGSGRYWR